MKEAAQRRATRRRLLQASARLERQRLALADAQASRAVHGVQAAATATAGAALLAGLALLLTRARPQARPGVSRRWAALAARAAGLLIFLTRASARRTA